MQRDALDLFSSGDRDKAMSLSALLIHIISAEGLNDTIVLPNPLLYE